VSIPDPELNRLAAALEELQNAAKNRAGMTKRRTTRASMLGPEAQPDRLPNMAIPSQKVPAMGRGIWSRISGAFRSVVSIVSKRDADR
jgi:hypothetical protein